MVAGRVNRVVQGCASTGTLLQDGVAKVAAVSRKILDDLRAVIECHQKRLVLPAAQSIKNEIDGCVLLEFQSLPNAVRCVQHHADAKRKVGRLAEVSDFLLRAIIEHLEIFLAQIGNEFFALGHHAEQNFHQLDVADNRALTARLRWNLWWGLRRCGRLRLLRPYRGHNCEKTNDTDPQSPFFHDCYTYGASAASIS